MLTMRLGTIKIRLQQGPEATAAPLLRGSWDLVIRVINKVPIVILNYNSN